MRDQDKTKAQLISELETLRRQSAESGASGTSQRSLGNGHGHGDGNGNGEMGLDDPQWHSLVANTPVFILILDQDGYIRFANHTDSGAPPDQIIGKNLCDFCTPENRENVLGCLQRVFQTGESGVREGPGLRLDHEEHWYASHYGPIFQDGKVIAASLISFKITERKRAEEELAKSKAVLQAAIDCLPFNFFAIGLDGRYMLQNAVSKAHQQADVIGKRPEDICSNKHDLAIWLDNNRRAFAGEQVEGEVTLSIVDEERSYYNVIVPIRDGEELHGILGVNIDITERKRAEDALQKAHDELEQRVKETRLNEARLEAVLHLSHMTEASEKEITDFALEQAVALTESKIGYVAFMNEDETVLTMHSWSKEVMGECAVSDTPLVYPVVTTGLWGEAARQRKPIVTNDYPAPNPWKKGIPEGHVGLRRHMNAPIIDEGCIVIVAGVGNKEADYNESDVRQLTLLMTGVWTLIQRNRIQAELRQHRDHLEQLVGERTQSLWRMLQASDHERQIISYEIHDGLAQYLAAAGMQFQAYESLKGNLPNEAKNAFDIAVGLVRQAHAESRRLINEVRPPVIDENGLEMAISHLVHEQRRHGGPKIECHNDVQFKRLPSVLENALYRIAQEALTNACKHSKSKKVTVTMTQEGEDVHLEVRDWGIGFDQDTVKDGHFGVEGIRQRVRLLGGRLTIESKPDSGTLIRVVVPILEQQTED